MPIPFGYLNAINLLRLTPWSCQNGKILANLIALARTNTAASFSNLLISAAAADLMKSSSPALMRRFKIWPRNLEWSKFHFCLLFCWANKNVLFRGWVIYRVVSCWCLCYSIGVKFSSGLQSCCMTEKSRVLCLNAKLFLENLSFCIIYLVLANSEKEYGI